MGDKLATHCHFIEKHAPNLPNSTKKGGFLVSDNNLVNSDNKAVKVQTITLSTLHAGRGGSHATRVGWLLRTSPHLSIAHAASSGIGAADI